MTYVINTLNSFSVTINTIPWQVNVCHQWFLAYSGLAQAHPNYHSSKLYTYSPLLALNMAVGAILR